MQKRSFCVVLTVLAVALGLARAASSADEPIVIRFSHVVAETAPKGVGAQRFKELAEARLPGRVRVEVFPASRKFTDEEVLIALLFGDVQMAAPSFTLFRAFAPAFQVYELPFLFRDVEHVHRFQAGATGQQMKDAMLGRGIRGLAYWDSGMRVMSANKALRVPADAEGLLFRIEPSQVFAAAYNRIGVTSLPIPFKMLPDAIREGLVNGQENSWSNIYTRGIHRLHRMFTELDHTFLGYMVVTSSAFWDGLPADVRATLAAVLDEVTAEVNALAGRAAEQDRARALGEGVELITPTADELALWRNAMTPVWKDFEAAIGASVIDAALAASLAPAR